jgi:hypothetical protein
MPAPPNLFTLTQRAWGIFPITAGGWLRFSACSLLATHVITVRVASSRHPLNS